MPLNWKILIFFDSNRLRSTRQGSLIYDSFSFSLDYEMLEGFILEHDLSDNVHLGVSSIVIEELKKQKIEEYYSDLENFKKCVKDLESIKNRLCQISSIRISYPEGGIKIDTSGFNCKKHISDSAIDFLSLKNIKIVEFPKENLTPVFERVIQKAINGKSPFTTAYHGGKMYSDAGFKDVLVWESLMNYSYIENYDEIFFLTDDKDFKDCKQEFSEKFNKHFEIFNDYDRVIRKLIDLFFFGNVENEKLIRFTKGSYFQEYLEDQMKEQKYIFVNEDKFLILKKEIMDSCSSFSKETDENHEETGDFWVTSLLKIHYLDYEGHEHKCDLEAKTLVDESLAPQYTDFELELE